MKEKSKKNTTLNGESIPTNFAWLSPEIQKKRANELINKTTKSKKKK